ncbi:1037_t:CDS:10, partial [Paraglomus brasilianum]
VFVKQEGCVCDRERLSEASYGKSPSSGWPAEFHCPETIGLLSNQERHVCWMLACSHPTPLAFFQYICPSHCVRAIDKYHRTLDLALDYTDDQKVLRRLRGMKNAMNEPRILSDWETWMQQKTAILVRRSVRNTHFNLHKEINAFAQTEEKQQKTGMVDEDDELEVYAEETVKDDGTKWIKQAKVRPRTDLAFYDIVDMTPGSNSNFVRSLDSKVVREISKSKLLLTPVIDNENGEKRRYGEVESFERDNDLADYNLSELGYRETFLTPLIRSLFREDRNTAKDDEENRNSGRKIDIIWCMKPTDLEFSICEVSGPPNKRDHRHFFTDKIKIAKMLKIYAIPSLIGGRKIM